MTPLLAAILTGLVVDQTGAYIPNVTVQYLPGRNVQTDITGRYTTPNLPAGTYTLRATSPDYPAFEIRTLKISAKTAVEIDGWIDPPETRKTLQPSKATAICL